MPEARQAMPMPYGMHAESPRTQRVGGFLVWDFWAKGRAPSPPRRRGVPPGKYQYSSHAHHAFTVDRVCDEATLARAQPLPQNPKHSRHGRCELLLVNTHFWKIRVELEHARAATLIYPSRYRICGGRSHTVTPGSPERNVSSCGTAGFSETLEDGALT